MRVNTLTIRPREVCTLVAVLAFMPLGENKHVLTLHQTIMSFMTPKKKAFENNMVKEENADKQDFLFFSQFLLPDQKHKSFAPHSFCCLRFGAVKTKIFYFGKD